jgi:tRNA1Val (adenine37-N6)-methyltransferase
MRASKNQFSFKQFTIKQDQCAMKVCTDSCIFGAFVPVDHSKKILDIGTGSGLLSFMLAQRSNASITAIEIEQNAAHQACENVKASPWPVRLEIIHTSLQDFGKSTDQRFDLIISNPPFFTQNLKSPVEGINAARHDDTLTLDDLANAVSKLLEAQGIFWVLLPEYEMDLFTNILYKQQLFAQSRLIIRNSVSGPVFRVIASFLRIQSSMIKSEELVIKDTTGDYTQDFVRLLKPYYLYL